MQDSVVRARIDTATKERAAEALASMGISISDAIRLLMIRVADERRLPFEVKAPNTTTRQDIEELEAGEGQKFDSVSEMMDDIDISENVNGICESQPVIDRRASFENGKKVANEKNIFELLTMPCDIDFEIRTFSHEIIPPADLS